MYMYLPPFFYSTDPASRALLSNIWSSLVNVIKRIKLYYTVVISAQYARIDNETKKIIVRFSIYHYTKYYTQRSTRWSVVFSVDNVIC